jgi:hypothetical protein
MKGKHRNNDHYPKNIKTQRRIQIVYSIDVLREFQGTILVEGRSEHVCNKQIVS